MVLQRTILSAAHASLRNKEHLPVLRQRPACIIDDLLEVVDEFAQGGEHIGHLVVCDGLFVLAGDLIGPLASLYHLVYAGVDLLQVAVDAIYCLHLHPAAVGGAAGLL